MFILPSDVHGGDTASRHIPDGQRLCSLYNVDEQSRNVKSCTCILIVKSNLPSFIIGHAVHTILFSYIITLPFP